MTKNTLYLHPVSGSAADGSRSARGASHRSAEHPKSTRRRTRQAARHGFRRAAPMGAVRLSGEPEPRFRHMRKLAAAMMLVAGGILITTTSTGKVVETAVSALAIKSADTLPVEPSLLLASPALTTNDLLPVEPTFFFDDASNALGDREPLMASTSTSSSDSLNQTYDPLGQLTDASAMIPGHPAAATEAAVAQRQEARHTASEESPSTATQVAMLEIDPAVMAMRKQAEAPDGSNKLLITVKPGDTLSGILNKHGVKVEHMPQVLTDDLVKKHLSNLRVGQTFDIVQTGDGDFHSLSARIGNDRRVSIRRATGGFAVASIDLPVEKERVVTSGTIEQSLYLAAEQANLKQSTIMELADVFQWELDFARDIRKGDQFSLVYDRLYREGKYIGDGDILAAEFVRGNRTHRAIRYTFENGSSGYYSPDGKSKRRTFLRHPVDVVRITSKFDPKRMHPVLHQIRAHRGVDYGAPHGSPIRAAADGKVIFSGRKNAYGNTVILQHGQKFSTLYAHMSKISGKSVVGKRVRQGDVIGYVGKTGRVTGTHLHYEFRVNGKHVDPLKVELPAAEPIPREYRDDLRAVADELLSQMRSVIPDSVAPQATARVASAN